MAEKIFQNQSVAFITGVIFIIFWSVIIGILNIGVLFLLGIPLIGLLIGIILVWIAKANIKEKILLTILPVPIILLSFFLWFEITKAEPETFLIPKDLRGEIVVFYAEPCGQHAVYENGRRIYQIPDSGILITNFKENRGHFERKFYLVDENKIEVPEFHWQNFDSEIRNWHLFHSTPSLELTKDSVGAVWSYGSETYELSRNSIAYTIGNFRDFEKDSKAQWLERKQFTETAEKLLKECRQSYQK